MGIKENDLFIFYEVIEQLEPQRILDIGLVLKRAGSVSRKAMNREVPEEVRLDGVDFSSEINFLACRNIYNEIMDGRAFSGSGFAGKYDCTFLLGVRELQREVQFNALLQKVQKCSRYVLSDLYFEEWIKTGCKAVDLKVEEDVYYLYNFGE